MLFLVGTRTLDGCVSCWPTMFLSPCRLFVLGIGFFTLCFLMTSLGGQFSARRLGDSPFTIRTEGILGVRTNKKYECSQVRGVMPPSSWVFWDLGL